MFKRFCNKKVTDCNKLLQGNASFLFIPSLPLECSNARVKLLLVSNSLPKYPNSSRCYSTDAKKNPDSDILSQVAPKRQKSKSTSVTDAALKTRATIQQSGASVPSTPTVTAELSTAKMEEKFDQLSKLSQEELEELSKKFEEDEESNTRVLQEDSVHQLDVSMEMRQQGGVRVFWSDVSVIPFPKQKGGIPWFHVALNGTRKVKIFESKTLPLVVPGEVLAYAIAQEWATQKEVLNKLLMPMTDLCSGAQHMTLGTMPSRVDYLMSFFQNDNIYFRSEPIQYKQDEMIEPIVEWWRRMFDGMELPRVVGIGHPKFANPDDVRKIREMMLALRLNPYQMVAMCVLAQCTSSLVLPLALLNNVCSISRVLQINRAEEFANIQSEGEIKGWHDIREADVILKVSAAVNALRMTENVSLAEASEVFSLNQGS